MMGSVVIEAEVNWRQTLEQVTVGSPFYVRHFASVDLLDSGLNLSDLPLTSKSDLALAGDDLLCCAVSKIVETVATSGTTGKPLLIHMTASDVLRLAEVERRAFDMMGLGCDDTVLLAVTMDRLFMAGLAYHRGAQAQGLRVLRLGPAQLDNAMDICKSLSPKAVVAVPSTLKLWLETWSKRFGSLESFPIQKALLIGEPLRNAKGEDTAHVQAIRAMAKIQLFGSYGVSEIQGSLVECGLGQGHHVHEDLHHVEVLNEEGHSVAEGELGEVVISTLGVEAMPLLRFKTGDVARIYRKVCACGRTGVRIGAIEGRLSQRLKVKGVNLFPDQVYRALAQLSGIGPYLLEVREASEGCDDLTLRCSVDEKWTSEALAERLSSSLRVKPRIILEEKDKILSAIAQHSGRKEVRFVDFRKVHS